jgi:hypothetical protein
MQLKPPLQFIPNLEFNLRWWTWPELAWGPKEWAEVINQVWCRDWIYN